MAEAQTDRKLWVNPQRPIDPFFPKDANKAKVFEIYRDSRIENFYRWFQAGHVMDFRLRQGESFTRWWQPQGGRWHHLPAFNTSFVRKLLEEEPLGYKSNHPEFSVWTQGNGLWRYAPNLTAASTDFPDGVRHARNLQRGDEGLTLTATGDGAAVFEVFTPWIIVPQVNQLEDPNDDVEASLVTFDATMPMSVSISLDHGRSWEDVATVPRGQQSVDLTPWVKGTYGFLLQFHAAGKAGDLVLRTFTVETWVQVAPISLPRLKKGQNRCRYEVGDRYGKPTAAMFITPNVADPEDLRKYVLEMPDDYDFERKTSRIRGDVVLQLEAPQGALIDWFTAGASFMTHQGQGARETDNRIAYATDQPANFEQIYQADVPTWVNHWRYQWDEDVLLREPAKVVFIRYTGAPGLNVIRATLHLRKQQRADTAVEITHGYRIANELIEKTVSMARPGDYTVFVDGVPENVFVRLSVPSRRK